MAALPLIDVEYIKANGALTPTSVDELVADLGDLTPIILGRQAYIESRLFKRYQVPFAAPAPEAAKQWLCDLVVERAYTRRGGNIDSDLLNAVTRAADTARDELKEAADAKDGLFDLPIRQADPNVSGISRGGPLGYSEPSPYDCLDVQAEARRGG